MLEICGIEQKSTTEGYDGYIDNGAGFIWNSSGEVVEIYEDGGGDSIYFQPARP